MNENMLIMTIELVVTFLHRTQYFLKNIKLTIANYRIKVLGMLRKLPLGSHIEW